MQSSSADTTILSACEDPGGDPPSEGEPCAPVAEGIRDYSFWMLTFGQSQTSLQTSQLKKTVQLEVQVYTPNSTVKEQPLRV